MLKRITNRVRSKPVQDNKYYIGKIKKGKKEGPGKLFDANYRLQYKGEFLDNMKHTTLAKVGKNYYENGDIYIGSFAKGQKSGLGKMTNANGVVYEGPFLADVKSGLGKMTYANGVVYEGPFLADVKSGHGKLTYPNGSIYEGSFLANVKSGLGKMIYADGDVYEGYFLKDVKSGLGILSFNGNTYNGNFRNDEISGEGVLTYANGNVYEGLFQKNEKSGFGTMKYKNGTYVGYFLNDKRSGNGMLNYSNGDVFTGIFDNSQLNVELSTGVLQGRNKKYIGTFRNGKLHGEITVINIKDGKTLKGLYENDKMITIMEGYGSKNYGQGEYRGNFSNGKRHGKGLMEYKNNKIKGNFVDDTLPNGEIEYTNGEYYVGGINKEINGREGEGTANYNNGDSYTGNFNGDVLAFGEKEMFLDMQLKQKRSPSSTPFSYTYGTNKSPAYIEPVCIMLPEIFDNYFKILKKIGSGAFGSVYSAQLTALGKIQFPDIPDRVAVKQMKMSDKEKNVFLNEVNILKQNAIPQLIHYYGCYYRNNILYLVMEYVEGVDLFDYIEVTRLTVQKKLIILKNIAIAIRDLHNAGLIHRDLKLENIMINPNDLTIKLVDYGFTCKINELSAWSCNSDVGTPGYFYPKLISGNTESMKRGDWWAFGQIIYILFTGDSLYDMNRGIYLKPNISNLPDKMKPLFLNIYNDAIRPSAEEIIQFFN